MKKISLTIATGIAILGLAGCSSTVEYDYLDDSFRYKPESDWSYINKLGPTDIPEIEEQEK